MPVTDKVMKYLLHLFSNQMNALSLATEVGVLGGWQRIQFPYRSRYPTDRPLQLTYLQLSSPKEVLARPTEADIGRSDRTPDDAERRDFSPKQTRFSGGAARVPATGMK